MIALTGPVKEPLLKCLQYGCRSTARVLTPDGILSVNPSVFDSNFRFARHSTGIVLEHFAESATKIMSPRRQQTSWVYI
jgi:hypothetical protein